MKVINFDWVSAAFVALMLIGVSGQTSAATIPMGPGPLVAGGIVVGTSDGLVTEADFGFTVDTGSLTELAIQAEAADTPSRTLTLSLLNDDFTPVSPAATIVGDMLYATIGAGDYIIRVIASSATQLSMSVEAVPLPAAAWLFLSVLAGAGLLSRKRGAAQREPQPMKALAA